MRRNKDYNEAIKLGCDILEDFEVQEIDLEIGFAALGNAFVHLGHQLGYSKNYLKEICDDAIDLLETE